MDPTGKGGGSLARCWCSCWAEPLVGWTSWGCAGAGSASRSAPPGAGPCSRPSTLLLGGAGFWLHRGSLAPPPPPSPWHTCTHQHSACHTKHKCASLWLIPERFLSQLRAQMKAVHACMHSCALHHLRQPLPPPALPPDLPPGPGPHCWVPLPGPHPLPHPCRHPLASPAAHCLPM